MSYEVIHADSKLSYVFNPAEAFPDVPIETLANALGYLPDFLKQNDPRPAREQFTANYGFGELFEFEGSRIDKDGTYHSAFEAPSEEEPGDPPMRPLAKTTLRDETIWFYQYGIVAIVQPDGSAFVTRMD